MKSNMADRARRSIQSYQHLLRPRYVLRPEGHAWPKDSKAETLPRQLRCAHSWAPFCHFTQMRFWQWPEYGEKIFMTGCDRCYYVGCQKRRLKCWKRNFQICLNKQIYLVLCLVVILPQGNAGSLFRTLVSHVQTDMEIMMEYQL